MQRVKQKADQSKEQRENIELPEEKVSVRGEPIPFKASIKKYIDKCLMSYLTIGINSRFVHMSILTASLD